MEARFTCTAVTVKPLADGGEVGVAVLVVVEESSPYPRVHRFEESGRLPLLEVATDDLQVQILMWKFT